MSQRTKPVKIPRKCINKMGVLNVQRCKVQVKHLIQFFYEMEPTNNLSATARVSNTGLRISYTSTRLISAYTISKVIVVCSKIVGTVTAHPRTSSSGRDGKAKTVILRSD